MSIIQIFGASAPPPSPPPNLNGLTTGLFGVYALYQLLTAYSGPAIQVRRSSDSTTQDINFLSGGGLDTASLLAFVGAGSGYVSIFYDQSGGGNHLENATAGQQPRIVNAGTYDAFVVFDGVDDILTCINNNNTPAAVTIYVVGTLRSTSSRQIIAQSDAGVGGTSAATGSVMLDYETSFHGYRTVLFTNGQANIIINECTGASLSANVNAAMSNFAGVSNVLRSAYYVNAVLQAPSYSNIGTISTSAVLSASKWTLGSGGSGGSQVPANLSDIAFVIYEAAHDPTAVANVNTVLQHYA